MFLSGRQTELLGRVMTTLAEPHEERDIRVQVGGLMLDLLQAQFYASYVWDTGQQRFDGGVNLNMDSANLARYESYYQFHDPITLTLQQHRKAVRVTDVMPQRELMRTEFFNDFLARDGLHWGVNLYAWSGDHNIGDMRIWRDRRHGDFSRADLDVLDLVRPALVAALRRSRSSEAPTPRVTLNAAGFEARLSAREREVAHLAACGLGDKAIARRLGISPTTVRTHIDHAYRKLGINNRVALARCLDR
jgi:DNA-binding CsgD family transcriptional regulator